MATRIMDMMIVIYRYYAEVCLFVTKNLHFLQKNVHFLDFLDFQSESQRQQAWGWEHPNM